MFFTYVLFSPSSNKIYIGFTANLSNRLIAHNHPNNKGWTAKFMPWVLLFHEEFPSKGDAMNREKQLKSAKGRKFIRNFIAQHY